MSSADLSIYMFFLVYFYAHPAHLFNFIDTFFHVYVKYYRYLTYFLFFTKFVYIEIKPIYIYHLFPLGGGRQHLRNDSFWSSLANQTFDYINKEINERSLLWLMFWMNNLYIMDSSH